MEKDENYYQLSEIKTYTRITASCMGIIAGAAIVSLCIPAFLYSINRKLDRIDQNTQTLVEILSKTNTLPNFPR